MVKLDKKWVTIGSVALATVLGGVVVGIIFVPPIQHLERDIKQQTRLLNEEKALLARKPSLQEEWEKKKTFFNPGTEPEAVLNVWVKELLVSAESQGLSLEKLEPAGIKTISGGKELTVFISFQGDIKKFVSFVYQLMDRDPLAQIESCDLRLEEGQTALSFELMLGKTVK